ncbi:glycosyltransferase [Sulfitobacter sp. S0837]|uniref:glycosyltransferase n=1 Tax=Sulfitobacter maritimus TaxID=2741719 RepID=UPI001581929E|nr:glycosyltransferase [Sulfitobacter maritimus]NUH63726.1 glycosyltransferase [Sulfitobacter maritimus]NUH63800.1 glycosyltransferase [Sulfitobacter maritimus]NUH65573.1 glycosyltransferase [Sulfitobacter maritimus]
MTVGSDGGLEAALPEPIGALKGRTTASDPRAFSLRQTDQNPNLAPIDLHAQQEAQKYQCSTTGKEEGSPSAPNQTQKVFAVVPADLPWAAKSLDESCGTLHVVLPTWFHLTTTKGRVEVRGVTEETRDSLWEYAAQNPSLKVMPILQIDPATSRLLTTEGGPETVTTALGNFFSLQPAENPVEGFCLDARPLTSLRENVFSTLSRQVTTDLNERELASCVKLPSSASDSLLVIANRFFDTVIVNGYQEYWLGSAPQPLADKHWFDRHIASLQRHVAPGKLVIELGTHAVDWISGRPRPEIQSFAKIMTALADQEKQPEFAAAVGNTRASYVDGQGRQHRTWMLEAASAHNQILNLQDRGVTAFGLSGLGYEDPGIWAVIDQTTRGRGLERESLQNIVLSNYVELLGDGPFVAPVSMPQVGKRLIEFTDTGKISAVSYEALPRASIVQLYGGGAPNQVVLTFDDGPHPKHTPAALDILKETQTPGSFFVLGNSAVAAPDLVTRILTEGHELGSHTYSHPNMGKVSAARAKVEINSTQLLLNGITGKNMRLYREPYMRSGGPITSKEVASLMPLEKAGYIIAGMDIVPRDWITQTADELADEIIRQVEINAGGVVLLHDGGGDQSQTVAALPRVISELREQGYTFTTLGELLGAPPDLLMPEGSRVTSTFGNMSFLAIGSSWSLLKIAFWSVFAIGIFRSVGLLLLATKRKRHVTSPTKDTPSVTIVIPAYNEGKVIEKCIREALYSDYPDFDIIVVDDGSTDNTYEKAISFAHHPLVTVLRQPNRGKAAALNAALNESQCEVLICIDADSQIAPDAVGLLATHFDDPQVGAVAGRVVVGNRGNLLTRLQALEYITAQAVERRAKEYLNAITVVPGAIGAWRATALMEAGIFSTETLTEDADMTMAMLRSDYQVIYEDRAVALTEAPTPLRALMTQRLRWSLGMMQAGWKHLGAIGERRSLGLVALPDLAIFGYLMPFIAPLADLFLILLLVEFFMTFGATEQDYADLLTNPLLIAYLALPALEILSAVIAFRFDPKEDRSLLLLLPLQRVYYRQVLYICVIQAVWRAATGSLASWGRMTRVGYRFEQAKLT